MPFSDNIPQASNLISNSQSQILANFAFLGDTTGNATPGFYKFPNNLIVQWGTITSWGTQTPISTYFSSTIAFPFAFSTECYVVLLTSNRDDASSTKTFVLDGNNPPTTTQFNVLWNIPLTSGYGDMDFIAIGV